MTETQELINYRHGDLALIGRFSLPEQYGKPSKDGIIMRGSHGHDHTVKNGELYLTHDDRFIIGYLVAKQGCILLHPEHGIQIKGKEQREAPISPGIYELRKQFEDTHDGMKQVID